MSNTNTLIPEIIYSPELIQSAIEFTIASKTPVFVMVTVNDSHFTVYGTMGQKNGRVIVSDDYGLSIASFRLAQVEAVGSKCIWLKP